MINSTTLGDMSGSFRLRQQMTGLRQKMDQLTTDLATGHSLTRAAQQAGGVLRLGALEHDLAVTGSQSLAAKEAQITTSAMQAALEHVQALVNDVASTAVLAVPNTGDAYLTVTAQKARSGFDALVPALNTQSAGMSLFAGTQVTTAPLAPAPDIMDAATAAVAGATSAADVMSALSALFDVPGGQFETDLYRGADADLAPFRLGSGESVALTLRADDPVLRDVMKNMVAAALVDHPAVSLSREEEHSLARMAGDGLMTAERSLVDIRANLGYAEGRIDAATSRLSAELSILERVRADLVAVDPFETATELQSVQTQIETIYTITARSSRLSLTAFLS